MNGHSLTKMTDMLHRIRSAIIQGECRLMESPKKTCTFYTSHKKGLSNLTQHFIYGIVPNAFMGWALILMLIAIFLFARESFTGRSSGSSLVHGVICLLGGRLRIRWWAPSPCATQLLLQLVNLTLHVSFILCMGDMALLPWLTLTSMCCLHTSFMISPLLWVYDWIITLRAPWFRLVRINIILMWPDRRLVRTWLFHFQH